MPITYLLIDIFENIEEFLEYLKILPSFKERYRVIGSLPDHIRDKGADRLYDREVIVKLESAEKDLLEAAIEEIEKHPRVKKMDKLDVRQL